MSALPLSSHRHALRARRRCNGTTALKRAEETWSLSWSLPISLQMLLLQPEVEGVPTTSLRVLLLQPEEEEEGVPISLQVLLLYPAVDGVPVVCEAAPVFTESMFAALTCNTTLFVRETFGRLPWAKLLASISASIASRALVMSKKSPTKPTPILDTKRDGSEISSYVPARPANSNTLRMVSAEQ